MVVLIEPSLDDFPGLSDRAEPPAVQTAIAENAVEALVVPILPWASRGDVVCLHALLCEPLPHGLCHELRAVITLEIRWRTKVGEKRFQFALHFGGRNRARHVDLEPDARVLVDHRQAAKTPTVRRLVGHEVVAPDVVRIPGLLRRRCRLMPPHTPLAPRQCQAFLAP